MTDTTATPQPPDIPVTMPLRALDEILSHFAASGWSRADKPALGWAWDEATAAKDRALGRQPEAPARPAEPTLPPGEWARVEIMGHDSCTGWVTDGTRAGVPVLVIRDHDGRVMREVPGQSLYQFVPLPTPLHRPQPLPLAALPAGVEYEDRDQPLPAHHFDESYDDGQDDDPADTAAGLPGMPF